MNTLTPTTLSVVDAAKQKIAQGNFTATDLDALIEQIRAGNGVPGRKVRQRLLYLHAQTPSIRAGLVGAALHEPVPGGTSQMDPMQKDPEYATVHEAVCDGWQIIQFPLQAAPFDDREIDILGYEFILQKLEVYDDQR